MLPDKIDITGKRKKGDQSGEGKMNKETKANAFKKQKTDLFDNSNLSNRKQTSVICFAGLSNDQRQPQHINEREIKIEQRSIGVKSEAERKQNMLRENQKKILMYKQLNGSERYSKITAQMQEDDKKNAFKPIFIQGNYQNPKFLDRQISKMTSKPTCSEFPPSLSPSNSSPTSSLQIIREPNLTKSRNLTRTPDPNSFQHPIPSPNLTKLSPQPTSSLHPIYSPHQTSSLHAAPSPQSKPSPNLTRSPLPTPSPPQPFSEELLQSQNSKISPHSIFSNFVHPKTYRHETTFGHPGLSPHSTPSPRPTESPRPHQSPHRKSSSHSILYPSTTPSPQSSPSSFRSSYTPPYLTNPTPPHHLIHPKSNSPDSNFQPIKTPSPELMHHKGDFSLYKTSTEPIDIASPAKHRPVYVEDIVSSGRTSPPYNDDIMGIVNMTPLYPSHQQDNFDNFLSQYSYKYITPIMQLEENEEEEESLNMSPEELTWVPIKKRARMTNYSVFPEKRHLNRKVIPVMAFTTEETAKIGQILIAQANMVSLESQYAMKMINPDLILEQETSRVEAVANGEKIIINEDYLQFRHKLSKEMFKTEGCIFFDQFGGLADQDRNILFEATFPSTIGLWFAYLHARRNAKNLVQQEKGLLCSSETEGYRRQNIPEIANSRSIRLDDFEIFTSPWAVNVEDEIKFESTITTVGDVIGKDYNISVIYFLMVLSHPHKDSVLCRNIQDKPAVLALQTDVNELMYRYLKSKEGYSEDLAAKAVRSLKHLVSRLHECAHIFWKKRLKTSMDTCEFGPICIDELAEHVWFKQIHTLED